MRMHIGTRGYNNLMARPSWSPDGSRFVAETGTQSYVVHRDDGTREHIGPPHGYTTGAAFSPDGTQLSFSAFAVPPGQSSPEWALYVSDNRGMNPRLVSHDDGWNSTWSPDGKKVAFLNGRGEKYLLSVVNADGTGQRQLSDDWFTNRPSWTPDSTSVVYDCGLLGRRKLYVTNAEDATTHRLRSFRGGFETNPAVSPDGRSVVFEHHYRQNGQADLAVMSLDGTQRPVLLTHADGREMDPMWSPDGSRIAFEGEVEGETELFVMNADGTDMSQVTQFDGLDKHAPSWSPDGRALAYLTIDAARRTDCGVVELPGKA
ncbi:MAG: hypothetical protein EB084_11720 [Proteobacteria bacterium]|nr:hypothetical protein [Pseudomonadota bacterium]